MNKEGKGLSAAGLVMMALGTVIGGSFFLGSSVAIKAAGPAVILSYVAGGILVYFILSALSELTVADPDPGSFRTYTAKAFGPGAGFVAGWVYWTGMVLAMSSEAAAMSVFVRAWFPGIPIAFVGSIVILAVTAVNLEGADKLSRLESGLAFIKLLAIAVFILLALLLVAGVWPGSTSIGFDHLTSEPFAPGGATGVAGSMLIVLFAYAGFEIIGLAAPEARDPKRTIPRAISITVILLVTLYIASVAMILLLFPTAELTEDVVPMVAALNRHGLMWAGSAVNFVLITAILSTMLAAMFGIGRMLRSLAQEHSAPRWLADKGEVPRRGILFSGAAMLAGLWFGLLLPRVYLFLVSSGGYALLFTYAVILASHLKLRKKTGCRGGACQMPWYPVSSWICLAALAAAVISMPFIPGQESGLFAGLFFTVLFTAVYAVKRAVAKRNKH